MSRTNIVIDEELIREAMKLTGVKSKRQAVEVALRNLVAKDSAYRALRRLRGKLPWQGSTDDLRRGRG